MRTFKIIVALVLLACLLPMPYGYYTLVRYLAMVLFAVMASQYWQKKQVSLMIVSCALALLFQPFFKVALGRGVWNLVDIAVALWLFHLIWKEHKEFKN